MKTYKELERDAYMAGNTELAKLYAELIDNKYYLDSRGCECEDYDDE